MLTSKMLKSSSQSSKVQINKNHNTIFTFTSRTITTPTPSTSNRIKQSFNSHPKSLTQGNSTQTPITNNNNKNTPLFNDYDNSNIERVISPKSRTKLRQIFLRYQENPNDQKSPNTIYNDITDYITITTPNTINHRNLFRAKASSMNKPYYTIENKSNSPYNNYRCTSSQGHDHYDREHRSVNSHRSNLVIKDAFMKKIKYDHLVTEVVHNKTDKGKGRNEQIKNNKKKPLNSLFNQMNNDKRIKAKIKQLKDFKFTVDYNADPDKMKHQQTIENNLTLLNEIKQKLEIDMNEMNDLDESISIEALNH